MNISYYTIDDIRLGHDPKGITGWRMRHFLSLDKALAQYRTMSAKAVKTLGVTDGVHVLELVRCQPLFSEDSTGEDILASDFRNFPLWAETREAEDAEQICITMLRLRYLLEDDCLIPIPDRKKLSKRFKGITLRFCDNDNIRWIYVAGQGLVPPEALKKPRSVLPIILHYVVEGVMKNGTIFTMEVSPWEYKQLVCRTKERHT